MSENPVNQEPSLSVPSQPSQAIEKCEIWTQGAYTSGYFGVRLSQPTENRLGVNLTSVERGIAIMALLDEEEKSRGYVLKKEGYRGDVLAQSPKAQIARASVAEIKVAVQDLIRGKVAHLNEQQGIYPVECSCGGVQLFIEKSAINPEHLLSNSNANSQSFVSCFFMRDGEKRSISIRYYRTSAGKCQYQYFQNDLRQIFGQEVADRIADHRKVLKATVAKYGQILDLIDNTLKITPDEIIAINAQFGPGAVS